MPSSVRENDADVAAWVAAHHIRTALDVGPGEGTYAKMLPAIDTFDAVEAWQPYVDTYGLRQLYNDVTVADVRDHDDFAYDLVIFGDVAEHLTEAEMVAVVNRARAAARWVLVSVPIIHWPQGAEGGNPFEVHLQEHVTPDLLTRLFGPPAFSWTYAMTGTFIWQGTCTAPA